MQVYEKLLYRFYKETDPPEMSHIGEDMGRVYTLSCGINLISLCQGICYVLKERCIQVLFAKNTPHVPESLRADIGMAIRGIGHV